MELSYDIVKTSTVSRNLEIKHKQILKYLTFQISELADIRTGSEHSGDVTAKTIEAVKVVKTFVMIS